MARSAVGNSSALHSWKKLCAPKPIAVAIMTTWTMATGMVSGNSASSAMPATWIAAEAVNSTRWFTRSESRMKMQKIDRMPMPKLSA